MNLTQTEIERVEAEAAAIDASPDQIAAALAWFEAIKTAAEDPSATADVVSAWELWVHRGAVIQRIDPGDIVMTQESPYVGARGVSFSTPGYIGIE